MEDDQESLDNGLEDMTAVFHEGRATVCVSTLLRNVCVLPVDSLAPHSCKVGLNLYI